MKSLMIASAVAASILGAGFTTTNASAMPLHGWRTLVSANADASTGSLIHQVLAVGTCGGQTCYVKVGKGVFGSIGFYCRPNPPCRRAEGTAARYRTDGYQRNPNSSPAGGFGRDKR